MPVQEPHISAQLAAVVWVLPLSAQLVAVAWAPPLVAVAQLAEELV
jgi:hypothetical protein